MGMCEKNFIELQNTLVLIVGRLVQYYSVMAEEIRYPWDKSTILLTEIIILIDISQRQFIVEQNTKRNVAYIFGKVKVITCIYSALIKPYQFLDA